MKSNSLKVEWDKIPIEGNLPDDMKSRMWSNIEKATIRKPRNRNGSLIVPFVVALLRKLRIRFCIYLHNVRKIFEDFRRGLDGHQ